MGVDLRFSRELREWHAIKFARVQTGHGKPSYTARLKHYFDSTRMPIEPRSLKRWRLQILIRMLSI
jgi:hypothetical protein